jgi:nanoRNase/pAp phosphatase (c-di-AMP/oligoRNAs hydrolase)
MKKIVILYHNYCPDGFGAAWAAWKKFGVRAEYIGVNHGELPPAGITGKEVYTLDFCYKGAVFDELLKKTKRLIVLDHHITQKSAIVRAHDYRFEMNHSGSVIAWNYFHPQEKVPKVLKHVEDEDLWKFKLPHTHEVGAVLASYPFDFKVRDTFIREFENAKKRQGYLKEGGAILRYQRRIMRANAETASLVEFAGHRVLAANSFAQTSEIGNILAKQQPPFGIVWSERDGRIIVSLRAIKNFDVSKIAVRFGGGGHKAAAGFSFPVEKKFPWTRLRRASAGKHTL